ncbi:hypothetical protein [Actinoplanes regularis]|uniref:Uncharacterized protein n=1 Tax=Actinoplanes regularis TaxID=52697 RepID=A0A239EY48_9ACTN|nr:hypothetical protein [Actinoplanes regularis]GIE89739.1 hypothetical protein Are01nite_62190 [Actinoplanes regularis]SNS49208.1 hypothetical protein SAMN06264365_116156 [Actinoplanes regularis]
MAHQPTVPVRQDDELGAFKIDIEQLLRIADLFRFRWDPPILAALAEMPCRFRALHKKLEVHVGEHVDDNALTRSLYRLTRAELVMIDSVQSGRRSIKMYSLGDKGREQLATYEAIVAVYTHLTYRKRNVTELVPCTGPHQAIQTEATDNLYVHKRQ